METKTKGPNNPITVTGCFWVERRQAGAVQSTFNLPWLAYTEGVRYAGYCVGDVHCGIPTSQMKEIKLKNGQFECPGCQLVNSVPGSATKCPDSTVECLPCTVPVA